MLVLSCMPLLCEMHADMKTTVRWEVCVIILLYTLFAFKAGSQSRGSESFLIYVQCCKASLCCVVAYAWMSFIFNIDSTLVTCLLMQAKGTQDNKFIDCQRHGLHMKCLDSLSFLKKMNAAVTRCPSSLLGSSLGSFYLLSTLVCRFIPAAVYGLWNLYTWSESRFKSKANVPLPGRTKPASSKGLLLCCLILLCCVHVEAAISNVIQLSTFTVILPFVVVLCFQTVLQKQRFRETAKMILLDIQRICVYVCVFYVCLDFVMNCTTLMTQCLVGKIESDDVRNNCINAQGPRGMEHCFASLGRIDATSYGYQDSCPSFGKPETTVLYAANVLQVVTLTVGIGLCYVIEIK